MPARDLLPPGPSTWDAFDQLATMVALVTPDGQCLFVNAVLESVIGLSRRTLNTRMLFEWFREPAALMDADRKSVV